MMMMVVMVNWKRVYRFNGKHIHVAWSKSTIEPKEDFHRKLLRMLPAGVRMFGRRELHHDGTSLERGCLWRERWQEAIEESDEERGWRMLRDFDPRVYMINHPALEKAMVKTKWPQILPTERERPKGRFRVPYLRIFAASCVLQSRTR